MAAGPALGGGKRGGAQQTAGVLNLLTDLAFNLLIFFVVLASDESENRGRPQKAPSSTESKAEDQKTQNIEVTITRTTVEVNKAEVPLPGLADKIRELLADKTQESDRIVVVKSDKDTPYSQWIRATGLIEQAGGVITLKLEEEKEKVVP